MKIYTMTATFGKLAHETLTLKPGLNVIAAGNEWGKSTWCAFLAAMLYGLDTREKSTKNHLAAKERYAPWSGTPMSGRMELSWKGRDITIERATRGRVPMGEFRAYDTHSGGEIPELDGRNCGEKLLGVERSVFLRSGFIRFSDLSVTDDEALRRRLHNLVTTGQEDSAAEGLSTQLRSLKNKLRHNRTGLLPQAEAEKAALEDTLRELERLEARNDELLRRMDELEDWRIALENHRDALAYSQSREDARRVAAAEQTCRNADTRYREVQARCDRLTDRETARQRLDSLRQSPGGRLSGNGAGYLWILGLLLGLAGLILLFYRQVPGLLCCLGGLLLTIWCLVRQNRREKELLAREIRELEQILSDWDARDGALHHLSSAREHYETLKSMARQAKPPEFPDRLTQSGEETTQLLAQCRQERRRLENLQGQCRGNMEALGDRNELQKQLAGVKERIDHLEKHYCAVVLAQETLAQASEELQRRFAPRIAKGAGQRMAMLTDGRYDRLAIGEDLSLRAGAQGEDTLREALWRSDGTVDQLYLSLRLAVAEALLPDSPLVLDDALVRFDDRRAKAAMTLLKEEAKHRQVIVFTCHDRESRML